jgi:hypothetical protein
LELEPHLDTLKADLVAAAAVGGPDVATAARLLGDAVEPALRLVLLDLLTEAAEELTTQLGGATVEVRMHGREPELVATAMHMPSEAPAEEPVGDEGTARLTLRLPESLKSRCEAAAASEGQSLNSWLVRAVTDALNPPGGWPFPGGFPFPGGPGGPRGGGFRGGPFPPGFPFPPSSGGSRRVTGYGRA